MVLQRRVRGRQVLWKNVRRRQTQSRERRLNGRRLKRLRFSSLIKHLLLPYEVYRLYLQITLSYFAKSHFSCNITLANRFSFINRNFFILLASESALLTIVRVYKSYLLTYLRRESVEVRNQDRIKFVSL